MCSTEKWNQLLPALPCVTVVACITNQYSPPCRHQTSTTPILVTQQFAKHGRLPMPAGAPQTPSAQAFRQSASASALTYLITGIRTSRIKTTHECIHVRWNSHAIRKVKSKPSSVPTYKLQMKLQTEVEMSTPASSRTYTGKTHNVR